MKRRDLLKAGVAAAITKLTASVLPAQEPTPLQAESGSKTNLRDIDGNEIEFKLNHNQPLTPIQEPGGEFHYIVNRSSTVDLCLKHGDEERSGSFVLHTEYEARDLLDKLELLEHWMLRQMQMGRVHPDCRENWHHLPDFVRFYARQTRENYLSDSLGPYTGMDLTTVPGIKDPNWMPDLSPSVYHFFDPKFIGKSYIMAADGKVVEFDPNHYLKGVRHGKA